MNSAACRLPPSAATVCGEGFIDWMRARMVFAEDEDDDDEEFEDDEDDDDDDGEGSRADSDEEFDRDAFTDEGMPAEGGTRLAALAIKIVPTS